MGISIRGCWRIFEEGGEGARGDEGYEIGIGCGVLFSMDGCVLVSEWELGVEFALRVPAFPRVYRCCTVVGWWVGKCMTGGGVGGGWKTEPSAIYTSIL